MSRPTKSCNSLRVACKMYSPFSYEAKAPMTSAEKKKLKALKPLIGDRLMNIITEDGRPYYKREREIREEEARRAQVKTPPRGVHGVFR